MLQLMGGLVSLIKKKTLLVILNYCQTTSGTGVFSLLKQNPGDYINHRDGHNIIIFYPPEDPALADARHAWGRGAPWALAVPGNAPASQDSQVSLGRELAHQSRPVSVCPRS